MRWEETRKPTVPGKEVYLAKLSEIDRSNLLRLAQRYGEVLTEEKRQGTLVATGSTLTGERRPKPLPAEQDIDLIAIFQSLPGEPEPDYFFEAQLEVFEVFRALIRRVAAGNSGFRIDHFTLPFTSPSGYMRHTGSVTLRAIGGGKPIELSLLNGPFKSIQDPILRDTPYSIILDQRGGKT